MEKDLAMYLLVNSSLGMKKGKIAAQVGHACCIFAYNNKGEPIFEKWFHSIQKKIILKAPQEVLEKYEQLSFLAIRDAGYTQVAPNSLTVINLGIFEKEQISQEISKLHLL